jgi:dihydrolipoamide dehydrogenase
VTLERGAARFTDPHTVVIDGARSVTADHFIIATGSRPRLLPEIAVDGHRIMTSDHIGQLPDFPRSLVIVGAGVVGCEFAAIFAGFGRTKVYLIDRADRILPFEDEDVAGVVAANFEASGVTVHRGARLQTMAVVGDQVEYTLVYGDGGTETLRVDHALISVGRVPNTDSLDLDAAGVQRDARGYLVNDDTRTSAPHIYGAGDVTEDIALVSVGEIEGRHAVERICGAARGALSHDNLSTIMFVDPEVGGIGMNELEARKRRLPYQVAVYGYALVNRAIAMRATEGFVKLLVTDDDDLRILGMRTLGVHASTSLQAISLAIATNQSVRVLAELLHPHPSVTEGVQECARLLLASSVNKAHVFPGDLRVCRVRYEDDGAVVECTPW